MAPERPPGCIGYAVQDARVGDEDGHGEGHDRQPSRPGCRRAREPPDKDGETDEKPQVGPERPEEREAQGEQVTEAKCLLLRLLKNCCLAVHMVHVMVMMVVAVVVMPLTAPRQRPVMLLDLDVDVVSAVLGLDGRHQGRGPNMGPVHADLLAVAVVILDLFVAMSAWPRPHAQTV